MSRYQILGYSEEENENNNNPTSSTNIGTQHGPENTLHSRCLQFINDMNKFGISVIDSFLGNQRGDLIYNEVIGLHCAGLFTDGQVVRSKTKNKCIRGDEVTWLMGNETSCPNINNLINEITKIVQEAGKYTNNGALGKYNIKGRTRAMVACYSNYGAQYVKHVDNPNSDGRVITAIYYLNKNWESKIHGGLLRIFPTDDPSRAANIEPKYDRLLFFWSDERNPHEVQPSFRTRYAITIWYLDTTAWVTRQTMDYAEKEKMNLNKANDIQAEKTELLKNENTPQQQSRPQKEPH